ncbi:hypothetical protein PSQ39_02740 [Curvibacter sp. HBC28]|uniref:Lipoprotein n=2 Tax=Curvibacter microcysteis TaxID=3026419 RepID=A0ABT5MEM0_9BURK|nr:hypothetical protein [Curvibacter sp. HBC28]
MMAADLPLWLRPALLATVWWLGACSAQADPMWQALGLIDARDPTQAVALAPLARPSAAGQWHYLPLTPAGIEAGPQCCVRVGTRPRPSDWMRHEAPLEGRAAKFTSAQPASGLVGLLLPPGTTVTPLPPSSLRLQWPGAAGAVRVHYCTSQEGLHVTLTTDKRPPQRRAYYVSLGMDVEPSCPPP